MKKTCLVLCCLLLTAASAFAQPSIRLSKVSWEVGKVQEGKILKEIISISNVGTELLDINLRAGCSCITFDRTKQRIKPGKKAALTITFDTKGKGGALTEYVYIDTNDPEFPYITFITEATVIVKNKTRENKIHVLSQSNAEEGIRVTMFSSPGCAECRELRNKFLPELALKHGLNIIVEDLSLSIKENYEQLVSLENSLGDRGNKLPALVIGNHILGGDREIRKKFGSILAAIREKGLTAPLKKETGTVKEAVQEKISSIRLLPIIGAGLLDGINPCAFATIIFFISFLAFSGRGGREILSTGISFTFAVFLCYTLIGLGAVKIIEKLSEFLPFVSLIIKGLTIGMVLILGIISIYDYIKCRQGKPREMKLQLSPLLKDKIHKTIASKREDFSGKDSRVFKLALAGFSVGILVSVFEFACTGQIYLPTIIYMLKVPGLRFGAFGYLILYNLMFIVPLIIIFILAWKGVTSEQLSSIMLKNLTKIKLGMAIFFFGMGILLLYT